MPLALAASSDVRRSPTQSHPDTQLSPSVTRSSPFHPRRNPPSRGGRPHLQAVTRDPPTWKPPTSGGSPTDSHPASPPPPSLPGTAVRLDAAAPSTHMLRNQAVEILEAGLQRQGCLSSSGKMSSPTHTFPQHVLAPQMRALPVRHEQSSSHDPFTPATPAFYASPSSPTTPAIPTTPSLSQESWNTPSSSKYPYPTIQTDVPSPTCSLSSRRRRSATTSSVPVPLPYRRNPVALPIGRRLPKWRETPQDQSPSQPYPNSTLLPKSTDASSLYPRPMRSPSGPRPIGSRSSSYSGGLGIDMSTVQVLERSRVYAGLRSHDSLDSRQWPDAYDDDDNDAYSYTLDNTQVQNAAVAQDDISPEHAEAHSVSVDTPVERPQSSTPAPPEGQQTVMQEDAQSSAPLLEPPFEFEERRATPESVERSAFDSDTEDEDDEVPDTLHRRLSKISKALRTSMSAPSLRAKLSVFSTTAPSPVVEESPESVAALRARQTTETPPSRNTYILKLATDLPSSAAPTSAGMNSADEPARTNADSFDSPATPVTPSSPATRQTKSFIWEMSKVQLLMPAELPPPVPALPLRPRQESSAPPMLPLPPTPQQQSISMTHLPLNHERPSPRHERNESFVERWRKEVQTERMTVVAHNASMAQLEQSIVKLEAFAPRSSSDTEETGESGPAESAQEQQQQRPPPPAVTVPSASDARQPVKARGIGQILRPVRSRASSDVKPRGVVVLGIEPSPKCSPKVPPRPGSANAAAAPPSKPARHQGPTAFSERPPRPGRKPSLVLLPAFDFEQPGGQGLCLPVRGLKPPTRTTSLPQDRDDGDSLAGASASASASPPPSASVAGSFHRREKSLPPRPHAPEPMSPATLGSSAGEAGSAVSVPVNPICDRDNASTGGGSPQPWRRPSGAHTRTPPGRVSAATEDTSVSSFMNFTPEQQKPERSRVRRLLARVDKSDIIKGIRGSFLA